MKKALFLHKPKTAGSYVCDRIHKASLLEHNKHVMWLNGWRYRGEDWDYDCLDSLYHLEIPKAQPIVHVHTVACDTKRFLKFKYNGWFSFMFHREPLDTIASALVYLAANKEYYPYAPDLLKQLEGKSVPQDMSELLRLVVVEEAKLPDVDRHFPWRLPPYYKHIDWVRKPTEENFIELFDILNIDYEPCDKINVSDNKGYQYYRDNGFISDEIHDAIISMDDYKIQQELWERLK